MLGFLENQRTNLTGGNSQELPRSRYGDATIQSLKGDGDVRRFSAKDLLDMRWVSDPQISPDGTEALYTVKTVSPEDRDKKYKVQVYMAKDGHGLPFTFGPNSDTTPRWSPDGRKVAFVSERGEDKTQLHVIPADGGEALQITSRKGGVGEPVWSPDGRKIAFSALPQEIEDKAKPKSDVRVITRIRFKFNGRGFLPEKPAQIHVLDVETRQISQITNGDYDCREPRWSPDGKTLAFVSARFQGHEYSSIRDIYLVPCEGGAMTKITATDVSLGGISWSPDGKAIAFYGHDDSRKGATVPGLCTVPVSGGPVRFLTRESELGVAQSASGDMGGSPGTPPAWSEDGKHLFFTALERGRTHLYRADVITGATEQITFGHCTVSGWTKAQDDDTFVVHVQSPALIGDIFVLDPAPSGGDSSSSPWGKFLEATGEHLDLAASSPYTVRRLSRVNEELLGSVALSLPLEFETESKDGAKVHGWVMMPVGIKEGVKYPLALEIHGGPHTAYGAAFFHEFQLLASRGYGVVFCNPRGSTGYGQEFLTAARHDWGGVDYEDVMAAVDYAASLPWVDSERMGVLGGSYGGYMTNWVVTHTDRFRAAVAQRSTCNRMSQFGASDAAFTNGEWEFDGDPWDNPKAYLDRSPLMYVRNVNTPLMLIHSEQDLRCPMEQAEEFFVALKKLGKTVVLVRFPDENHELSRSGGSKHRIERLEYIVAWFDRYLKPVSGDYDPGLSDRGRQAVTLPENI